jgi:hypothetical protein
MAVTWGAVLCCACLGAKTTAAEDTRFLPTPKSVKMGVYEVEKQRARGTGFRVQGEAYHRNPLTTTHQPLQAL